LSLSIAIPDSSLLDESTTLFKTKKISMIARTCAIFKIKQIFIYQDEKGNKNDSAHLIVKNTTISIPLKGIVDTKNELEKITNKKDKYLNELQNLESKLSNTSFLEKAPPEIVDQFKEQTVNIKTSIEKLDQIINTIT